MITSTSNAKVKNLIKCIKSAKERRKQGVFIVEGIRMFLEIPDEIHLETYMTEDFYAQHQHMIMEKGLQFELVANHVMEALSDTKTPQGVISICRQLSYTLDEVCNSIGLEQNQAPLILALENVQDPGNLGTMIRTAEGAGVTGVIMSRDTVDIYNPKVVRSTMGSVFRVPFIYVDDLVHCVRDLSNNGFQSFSAHLQGKSFYDYSYVEPTIFVIGNEGNGLTDAMSEVTDRKILIPMQGRVESLNAATATTVLIYEAIRQRTHTI